MWSTWVYRVMHNTCVKYWKRHQDAVYWVDINLAIEKGLKFYQTRSNVIILHETLPAYCIPKVCEDGNWRSHIRNSIHVTSASTNDLFETRVERELGSEHAQRSEVGQLPRSVQSNQPILNPNRERAEIIRDDTRTVQDGRKTSRSQEIDVNSFDEESVSSERTRETRYLKRV